MRKHPIELLIEQGEGLRLDFKFGITDAAKIARSLSAFANTEGGKLLIGVEDNGVVRGVELEEEFFMIEKAARNYCKPEVPFKSKDWMVEGKKVLEVSIPASEKKPHKAPDKDGRFKAFYRFRDENLLASGVQMKVWTKYYSSHNISISIEGDNKWLLEYLQEYSTITVNEFRNYAGISKYRAEDILSDFVVIEVIKMKVDKKEIVFSLQ